MKAMAEDDAFLKKWHADMQRQLLDDTNALLPTEDGENQVRRQHDSLIAELDTKEKLNEGDAEQRGAGH